MNRHIIWWFVLTIFVVISCKNNSENTPPEKVEAKLEKYESNPPVAYSLLGDPLFRREGDPVSEKRKDSLLFDAQGKYYEDPDDLDNIIWYGRRMAYKDYHNEAINMFNEGLEKHPASPELYRHRGHRYITTRRFNMAVLDLKKAAELMKGRKPQIEPDGIPNKINTPLSTLQFNVYYHLGLAHYLLGDYASAINAYEQCMKYSDNDDLLVATSDWMYLTYKKLGEDEKANAILNRIKTTMNLVENEAYHKRLLVYKGEINPEEVISFTGTSRDALTTVTMGYGLANHYLFTGNRAKYLDMLEEIIDTGFWAAFGFIAAEADLQRIRLGS